MTSVDIDIHRWWFKNIHVVKLEALVILTIDPIKLNNAVNIFFLSNLNIILISFSKVEYSFIFKNLDVSLAS